MKKIILGFIFLIGLITLVDTFAHPGRTASDGCHYCRTNCSARGVGRNVRHCHGGGTSSSYSTSSYTSCPSNSYKSGTSCKCYSGYYASGSSCVKEKTCSDLYGYGSNENSSGKCECSSGYVWGKDYSGNNKCVSCNTKYGFNSSYNYVSESCTCDDGYSLSKKTFGDGYECKKDNSNYIAPSYSSTKNCGLNSSKNSDGKCSCDTGYLWEDADDEKNLDCKKKTIYNTCPTTKNIYLGTDYKCYCKSGYLWDVNKCSKVKVKTGVELCKESYGIYTTSNNIKNTNGQYDCTCKNGYDWNNTKTKCIINLKEESIIEDKTEIAFNKKVDKIFDKLKSKYSKYSETEKYKKYKLLSENLEKFKITKSDNVGLVKILDRLIILLNKELSNNLNEVCDEVSALLGLCELK